MYELSFRVEPEQELFRFLSDKKLIMSYCTGERGLLIYTASDDSNEGILLNDNYVLDHSISFESVQDSNSTDLLQFDCDCILNPPSIIRKKIDKYNGILINPVIIRNNWEHTTVLIESYSKSQQFIDELRDNYELMVIKIEKVDYQKVFSYAKTIEEMLHSLTDQQQKILIQAWKKGYYSIPRKIKTEELASVEGISRYGLEKKLRTAENKLMEKILPILLLSNPIQSS
ncbi:MAG: helix-turn-helix domain-containing protein [Candidatus Hodarchaeales archaeon]|jgi:predicted DNA binding protein